MVAFNESTMAYNAVARVLLNRQDGDTYGTAISQVFDHVTTKHPLFRNGKNLRQIMMVFDQAEYNGFERSIGAELCQKIMRGCTVHWKTSVNRISDIVTRSKEECSIFRQIAHGIQDFKTKADVKVAFDVLCGKGKVSNVKHLLTPKQAAVWDQIAIEHWSKASHWVKWWSRERILRMFCKAHTLRDKEEWEETPNADNPVESLNRQSIGEGCSNISVLMKNIYMEDRLHAVKIVASEPNVNISYEMNTQEEREKKRKKRKRSRLSLKGVGSCLNDVEPEMEQTPPDKRQRLDKRSLKRDTNKERMIGTRIEVEYEENVNGEVKYLGWIKGTIMDYDKSKGYFVQFPDDLDWIPDLNSKDVRIII